MDETLSNCGCCSGTSAGTPVHLHNAAGLATISYRLGTHSTFLASMLARLSSSANQALQDLKTRDSNDLTVAFLDAAAAVDDVLTFYTERYANESYLRTAVERVSLVQVARLIGYELRPGVAASAYLAFTIEDTPGSPESVELAAGVRVNSIPKPNQLPQTYETVQAIQGRSAWNAMRARSRQPHPVNVALETIIIQGLGGGIRKGDMLLIVNGNQQKAKRVLKIVSDPARQQTTLYVKEPEAAGTGFLVLSIYQASGALGNIAWGTNQSLNNNSVSNVLFGGSGSAYSQSDLAAYALVNSWSSLHLSVTLNTPKPPDDLVDENGVFLLKERAAVFGHNAPKWETLPQTVKVGSDYKSIPGKLTTGMDAANLQYPTNWDSFKLSDVKPSANAVDLDNTYPEVARGTWVALENAASGAVPYRVWNNQEQTRTDYTLSSKVSRLTLSSESGFSGFGMRDTTVHGGSEKLPLADLPVPGPLAGSEIVLDKYYAGLAAGQTIIVTGEREDLKGVVESEVCTIGSVVIDGTLEPQTQRAFTRLILKGPLVNRYILDTVVVNANVALATHGEAVAEVLGGGDARQRFQQFILRQNPLTYVSATTETGAQSTLEVRVNGLKWTEAPTLYGVAEGERVYAVKHEDDGRTIVKFGSRLPSGTENVTVRYRKGIGVAGLVEPGQLTLLAVRPLGVRSVVNPLAASGAQDRETLADVRTNAPLTVLTMGRLVSLQDYEDFARAFSGFTKAHAAPLASGEKQAIFVTVAGAVETPPAPNSPEMGKLTDAMARYSDPFTRFEVKPYQRKYFQVEAGVAVDPAYETAAVLEAVRALLRNEFSFANRRLGQAVTKSSVIATIQSVPGVRYVDLTALFETGTARSVQPRIDAPLPSAGATVQSATPAAMLILDPRPIAIGVIS